MTRKVQNIEREFDVTEKSDKYIETLMNGISQNLDIDNYSVRDHIAQA